MIGGGGEAGPTTRTPEVALSRLTEAGITSVVGLLGTDSISRHPESLLAKTRALNEEAHQRPDADRRLSCPFPHYYGFRGKDVAIIDRVIGVKCAISDHRSAAPDVYHRLIWRRNPALAVCSAVNPALPCSTWVTAKGVTASL